MWSENGLRCSFQVVIIFLLELDGNLHFYSFKLKKHAYRPCMWSLRGSEEQQVSKNKE